MKILGGLYTTGGVHTHPLCTSLKKDTKVKIKADHLI